MTGQTILRQEIIEALKEITDLERNTARIVTGTANARDMVALAQGSRQLPALKKLLSGCQSALLQECCSTLDDLSDLRERIDRAIVDEPPLTVRDGGTEGQGARAEGQTASSRTENELL